MELQYTPELSILSILRIKDIYKKYYDGIDKKHIKETYRELSFIYTALEDIHTCTERDISLRELEVFFWNKYPTADKDIYQGLFDRLEASQLSPEVGEKILLDIQKRTAALKAAELLVKVSNGSADFDSCSPYLDFLRNARGVPGTDELLPLSVNLEELLEDVYQRPGLRWRLGCLNKSLGSLRAGDFGFIFARPETGKTTFLASEVSNFLTQTDRPIVWFNNEEQGQKVILRVYQAFFGCRLEQLIANKARYKKEFEERTDGRLIFYDSAGLTNVQVERVLSSIRPAVVVHDQIDKVKGFAADREDLRLGAIYQWSRELAKNSHAVIGVCQADGSAENQRYLNMDNVANAKTSKQAEGDWILGIGKIHDPGSEYVRFLNICKNKLFGDEDSNPELKHGRFETIIEPQIARYRDVISYD